VVDVIRFVVGGAIDRQKVAEAIKKAGGDRVEVKVMGDVEAVLALKNGEADYYLGACATGGGGALAMAMALLGAGNCATVSIDKFPICVSPFLNGFTIIIKSTLTIMPP